MRVDICGQIQVMLDEQNAQGFATCQIDQDRAD